MVLLLDALGWTRETMTAIEGADDEVLVRRPAGTGGRR